MASVTLKNVCKTYISKKNEEVKAVRDLNLEVRDGEFMCLLGPSGCGKSSSMRMIVGLEETTSGDIFIGNRKVNELSPRDRNVAMSFETYALYTHLTVRENILFPLRAKKIPEIEQMNRLEQVVNMLEIGDLLDRGPSQLSGGQQQRISLARALIREPEVFLLDEPLSHLDVTLRTSTRAQIKHLHDELKTTFIYVTHDQLEAISLADRIAVMNFAVLQQVGTREELLDYPINKFVADFIGEPAINFFECTLIEDNGTSTLKSNKGTLEFKVPQKWNSRLVAHGSKHYTLGIRPHDIHVEKSPDTTAITGVVDVFEFLGEENHVTAQIDGDVLTVVVSPYQFYTVGEKVNFYVPNGRVHIFDTETGECVSTAYKLEDKE
ncbi:ABC transporter ATP-binding protein [Marispirochaeta aestuarii]|uniref:ABC transporter ATP-binding protein n=1 Tax=Marispirochaeta aestuarii TaxID=1963862 RepID=UPI0029C9A94A|nr:ABC transporter ATP-binding protein [Marispirochaeta aestuarii]